MFTAIYNALVASIGTIEIQNEYLSFHVYLCVPAFDSPVCLFTYARETNETTRTMPLFVVNNYKLPDIENKIVILRVLDKQLSIFEINLYVKAQV